MRPHKEIVQMLNGYARDYKVVSKDLRYIVDSQAFDFIFKTFSFNEDFSDEYPSVSCQRTDLITCYINYYELFKKNTLEKEV